MSAVDEWGRHLSHGIRLSEWHIIKHAEAAIAELENRLKAAEAMSADAWRQVRIARDRAERAEAALDTANRFVNRYIVHGGEARPYSVRDLQLRMEEAEAALEEARHDATMAYRLWLQHHYDEMGELLEPHSADFARHDAGGEG